MKQILLSFVLLSSMPLFSKDATANPTATVGNSASAAAVPESDVKRLDAEADVKSDSSSFSLEQIHGAVIPALNNYLPEQLSYLVAGGVAAERDLGVLKIQQMKLADKWLIGRIIAVAKPNPSWQVIKELLQQSFIQHGVGFLPELTNIVADYAQGSIEPIQAILKKVADDPSFTVEYLSHTSLMWGIALPLGEDMANLIEAQGAVFGHDRQVLDRWKRAGFVFHPQLYRNDPYVWTRVICLECHNSYTPRGKGNYGDVFGRRGRLFGDVTGPSLFWRDPFSYHRKGCKTAAKIKESMSMEEIARPNRVPILRTHPKEFAAYILLQLDLWVRRCWRDSYGHHAPTIYSDTLKNWMALTVLWALFELPHELSVYAFERDPQAWVDLQNKRAAELGSTVRYKLPEKPTTK